MHIRQGHLNLFGHSIVVLYMFRCVSSLGSGLSTRSERRRRVDTPADKLVRKLMLVHIPPRLSQVSSASENLLGKENVPSDHIFQMNHSKQLSTPCLGASKKTGEISAVVTFDLASNLKNSLNLQIARSVIDKVVLAISGATRKDITRRVCTYFNTLKRRFNRVLSGQIVTDQKRASFARRRGRVRAIHRSATP
jgi:hypothetical protein